MVIVYGALTDLREASMEPKAHPRNFAGFEPPAQTISDTARRKTAPLRSAEPAFAEGNLTAWTSRLSMKPKTGCVVVSRRDARPE